MELTISHISPGFHVYLHLVNSCLKFWRLNSDGEQGITQWWEHSPPTDVVRVQIPASTPYVVQFVVGSLPPRGFSPGTPVFPSPQKTTTFKFQFDQKSGRRRTTLWICYPQNHYLFILFIYQMLLLLSTKDTERLGFTTVTLCLGK